MKRSDLIGTVIAGYEVQRVLSRGGMGEVLLAVRRGARGFERVVAIKTIRGELADNEELRTMFVDEARLMGRLHHPAIAQVHDLVEQEDLLCLVMEYVAGVSFSALSEHRPPPAICAQAIAEACRGLDAAHELTDPSGRHLGVVHRDISPANLMVTFEGRVKVLDFGIAYTRSRGAPQTEFGLIKGKPPYMAPEQLKQERIDRRTDVFACGVVLWEMLTGQRLYSGSPYEVVKQMMDPVQAPSSIAGPLPEGLDEIVLRALAEDPDERWQKASAMANALGAVADDSEDVQSWVKRELADVAAKHRVMLASHDTPQGPVGRATGVGTIADGEQPKADSPPQTDTAAVTEPVAVPVKPYPRWWLAAAVALVVAGSAWFMRGDAPLRLLAMLPTVDVTAEPAAASASAPEPTDSAPAPTGSTPTAATGPAPEVTATATATATPSAAPSTSAEAIEYGWLNFGAKPYAIVTLDGTTVGPTPFKTRVRAGPHSVVMTDPSTRAVRLSTSVTVAAGQTRDVIAR